MAENKLRSRTVWLVKIVSRVPKAMAAAVTTFLDTLTRPEAPLVGSVESLAQFGVQQDRLLDALQMFLDDRAVRPRKLKKRFGNAGGTNILSLCEVRDFIAKPQGSNRWKIDLKRVRAYQEQHGSDSDAAADAPK